jgi:hypothetical protein
MEPVKRSTHNHVYLGPTPDIGDLSCERRDGGVYSHWRPSQADLDVLNAGGVIELGLFHEPIPPISLGVKLPEPEEKTSDPAIPDDYWKPVPCGHPTDPVAKYGSDGRPICHCGVVLEPMPGLPRPPEAPGPIAHCQSCGCYVAVPPKEAGDGR